LEKSIAIGGDVLSLGVFVNTSGNLFLITCHPNTFMQIHYFRVFLSMLVVIFFGLHGIQTHIFTSSHAKFYVYVFYKGGLRSMSCRTNHHLVIPQSQGLGCLNYFLYTDIETVNASYDLP
jgi:hypothetical protein